MIGQRLAERGQDIVVSLRRQKEVYIIRYLHLGSISSDRREWQRVSGIPQMWRGIANQMLILILSLGNDQTTEPQSPVSKPVAFDIVLGQNDSDNLSSLAPSRPPRRLKVVPLFHKFSSFRS